VIAISRFAARQGVEHLGIDPARITVVHPGIDEHFRPGPALGAGDGAPYLSMVSEYSPRKGFGFAFEVIARLAEAGFEHRLKVAGRVPGWQRAAFERELAAARRPDRIDLLGYVTDLAPLYRGAAAHLVTSRHEGFGLSAAEAMACGTPVVAFRNSALEEVVGGGGLLVADGDVAAASEALASLARSPRRRQEVSQAGLEWSRRFNWDQAARLHCEVYRSVAIS
jgi:glycosyltransferase involved in cell wall biosynthesis